MGRGMPPPSADRADGMSESGAAEHAVALLRTDSHDPAEVELALGAVVDGGPAAISAFCLSFGPRHLMRALGSNRLSDRAAELADELLTACDGVGLTRDVDFGDVHHDQLYPDELINLSVREVPAVPGVAERLPLHLMGGQAAPYPWGQLLYVAVSWESVFRNLT